MLQPPRGLEVGRQAQARAPRAQGARPLDGHGPHHQAQVPEWQTPHADPRPSCARPHPSRFPVGRAIDPNLRARRARPYRLGQPGVPDPDRAPGPPPDQESDVTLGTRRNHPWTRKTKLIDYLCCPITPETSTPLRTADRRTIEQSHSRRRPDRARRHDRRSRADRVAKARHRVMEACHGLDLARGNARVLQGHLLVHLK